MGSQGAEVEQVREGNELKALAFWFLMTAYSKDTVTPPVLVQMAIAK